MGKLICMGECLIDFIPNNNNGEIGYIAKAGGAPANVCAGVSKLGAKAYYLGKMAKDSFAKFLAQNLIDSGVNMDYVAYTDVAQTALAFVTLNEEGDRDFSFYRNPSADMLLTEDEVSADMFEDGDILHFCSVALVESPTKYAHTRAIQYAKASGAKISFDVNVRLPLWKDKELLKSTIIEFLKYADMVKITDEELEFVTDIAEESVAIKKLFEMSSNASIVFVTRGKYGATVYNRELVRVDREAVDVKVVDTTGAGDCFASGIIYSILTGNANLSISRLTKALDFASYCSAVVIGKKGAIESMPTISEVKELMKSFEENI